GRGGEGGCGGSWGRGWGRGDAAAEVVQGPRAAFSGAGEPRRVAADVLDRVEEDLGDVVVVVRPGAGLLLVVLVVEGGTQRLAVELHGRLLRWADEAVVVRVLVPVGVGRRVVGAVARPGRRRGAVRPVGAVLLDGGVQPGRKRRDLRLRLRRRVAVEVVLGAERRGDGVERLEAVTHGAGGHELGLEAVAAVLHVAEVALGAGVRRLRVLPTRERA